MKLKALILLSAVLLSGCNHDPVDVKTAGNGVNVGKLFTVDGCTVYRFSDGGNSIYFSNCNGQTQYDYSDGKTSHRVQSLTNLQQSDISGQ